MDQPCSKPLLGPPHSSTSQPSSVIPNFPYAAYAPQTVEVIPTSSDYHSRPVEMASRQYRMRKRMPAQVYHCVQCNKNIKYPSKITEHIRKHTGEKPHVCVICNQSFSQAHTLKTHMQQHVHEKPFKCSFCPMEFLDVDDKKEHEQQHMHHVDHQEPMVGPSTHFIEVDDTVPIEDNEQVCSYYQCPLSCGFQSFDESVVVDHIATVHERYGTVCWEEPNESQIDQERSQRGMKLPINTIPLQNGVVVQNFTEEPDQLYEYYGEEQYVAPVVASENVQSEEVVEEEPCTSSSIAYESHFDQQGTSSQGIAMEEIIYEGDEHDINNVSKKIIIDEKDGEVVDDQIYDEMLLEDIDEEIEVGSDDEQERVRVIVNPNPPKRGTKSARDHHEASAAMTEMVVDASTLEMAAPIRHLKHGYLAGRKKRGKKAENLDWIIDAVAKGVDVNDASPHHRKKPTLHKCEFCGKVDKYPSKIRAHMRTHTGEKPYKCEICGMAFSQRTPMRLHLRRHFDQKPYECDVDGCKERFVSGAILKMHVEKKHLNKKKYVCIRGCGRVFSSSFNQRHHEKKCSQNTYLTWIEEPESGEESTGEYQEEDEVYMDEMLHHPLESEPNQVNEQFNEGPAFLHQ